MNGIRDMGGMDGMGPMHIEKNEPVCHAEWEGRIHAIAVALRLPPEPEVHPGKTYCWNREWMVG